MVYLVAALQELFQAMSAGGFVRWLILAASLSAFRSTSGHWLSAKVWRAASSWADIQSRLRPFIWQTNPCEAFMEMWAGRATSSIHLTPMPPRWIGSEAWI